MKKLFAPVMRIALTAANLSVQSVTIQAADKSNFNEIKRKIKKNHKV